MFSAKALLITQQYLTVTLVLVPQMSGRSPPAFPATEKLSDRQYKAGLTIAPALLIPPPFFISTDCIGAEVGNHKGV